MLNLAHIGEGNALEYERLCRELAAKLTRPDDKQSLELMGSAWAKIAADRKINLMEASRPKRGQR
jgi:hypothetical protein